MKARYIVDPRKHHYVIMFYCAFYKAHTYAVCWMFCSKNIIPTIPGGDYKYVVWLWPILHPAAPAQR